MHDLAPRITIEAFHRLVDEAVPIQKLFGVYAEEIGHGWARCRLPAKPEVLRPGGTISGPAQMALADFAMYAAVLGAIGEVPLAVTTSLTVNFVMRPQPGDLIADARLFKLGRRLAVGEIRVTAPDDPQVVCHVTATYSIPPEAVPAASG